MTTKRKETLKTTPRTRSDLAPFDEMDRLFDTMLNRRWLQPFNEMLPHWPFYGEQQFDMRIPRVDVLDWEDEILMRAELPGVEKKDLDVSLTGQTLAITFGSKGVTKLAQRLNKTGQAKGTRPFTKPFGRA